MLSQIGQPSTITGSKQDNRGYEAVTVTIHPAYQGIYKVKEQGSKGDSETNVIPSREALLILLAGPYHALYREVAPSVTDPLKRAIGRARGDKTMTVFVPSGGYLEEIDVPVDWILRVERQTEQRPDYRRWGRISQEIVKTDA